MMRPYLVAGMGVLAAAVILVMAVLGGPRDGAEERLQAGYPLRVGYAIEAPFAFVERNGQVSGEAPVVLRAVMARLGVGKLEWVYSDFGSLLSDLQTGRIDVIAAGMFITPARGEVALHTRPTASVVPGLLMRAGDSSRLHGLEDIGRWPEARLAVIDGAVEKDLALRAGVLPRQIVDFPDAHSAAVAVERGRVDALALSTVSLRYLASEEGLSGLLVVPAFAGDRNDVVRGMPAFFFRKADAAMRDRVDEAMAEFIGSPEHLTAVARFGFTWEDLRGTSVAAAGRSPR